jgi:hypothetical protein
LVIGQDIDNTITNLEKIRDAKNPPSQDVLDQIDELNDLAVKYAAAQIDQATAQYTAMANSFSTAAQATLNATNDLSKVADAVSKAASAIKLLTEILSAA